MLGPLVGGWLMDSMPTTREVGCVEGMKERTREGAGEAGVNYHLVEMHCRSAFPWTAAVWGGVGWVLVVLLWVGAMRLKRGGKEGEGVEEEEEGGVWAVVRQRLLCCPRSTPRPSCLASTSGVLLEGGDEEGGRGAEGGGGEGGVPLTHLPIPMFPGKEGGKKGEEGRKNGLSHPQ